MFGSTVLEVAIGMIFVYLLLSLLCSAVNEYIESWLQYRSKNLWKGVQLLLNGQIDDGKAKPDMRADARPGGAATPTTPQPAAGERQDLASELYQHGLVRALFRDEHSLPSYIPSRTFALALWNLASRKAGELPAASPPGNASFATTDLKKIKEVIDQLPNKELAQALGTLIDEAKGDFGRAVKNVEDWYDGAMDRVSGWYKRRVQKHLIIIGCVAALLINADSVNIAKSLIQDKALRDVVVASADDYMREQSTAAAPAVVASSPGAPVGGGGASAVNANNAAGGGGDANVANPGGARPASSPSPSVSPTPAPDPEAKIRRVRNQLFDLGLPIGWAFDRSYTQDPRGVPQKGERWTLATGGWLILKLFGLFMTGLAISQGAPFWFDLLNKFMVIRSTVKPKEKSQEQPSKDKPAPKTEVDEEAGDAGGGKG